MRITPLASGSQGNSLLLTSGTQALLVDAGLPADELERRLLLVGQLPGRLTGVLLTHRHGDHVAGVFNLCRTYRIPVLATRSTARCLGTQLRRRIRLFEPEQEFECGDLRVHAVRLSHDAPDTVGFRFDDGRARFGYATDLGCLGGSITRVFARCDALLLEFNHDPAMLADGPYPFPLKRRIAAPTGHLANAQGGALLRHLRWSGLRQVFLGHLSRFNNTPERAMAAAASALGDDLGRVRVVVARQYEPTETLALGAARTEPAACALAR